MNSLTFFNFNNPEDYEWLVQSVSDISYLQDKLNELASGGWYIFQMDYNSETGTRGISSYRKKR